MRFLSCVFVVLLALPLGCASTAQDNLARRDALERSDAERIIEALQARPGQVLADVGAGTQAPMALHVARYLGAEGRLYATELRESLQTLRDTVRRAGVQNIEVLEAGTDRSNLPADCCDGIYMRNVYHHIAASGAMNASLLSALKPGGRLVVLDFMPDRGSATSPDRDGGDLHGVEADAVARELLAAGFEVLANESQAHGNFLVVARKPSPTGSDR